MKTKKLPLRMCVACRSMKQKKELIRVVRDSNHIRIDRTGKLSSRGAYICYDRACLAKAKKTFALDRALQQGVPEETYREMEGLLS